MLQSCGEIAVALIKCLHRVQKLVLRLSGQTVGKIAQLLGVVDIVVKHVLQNGHGLGIGCAAFGVKMLVMVIMMIVVMMVVAMSVLVGVSMGMLVVMMAHE